MLLNFRERERERLISSKITSLIHTVCLTHCLIIHCVTDCTIKLYLQIVSSNCIIKLYHQTVLSNCIIRLYHQTVPSAYIISILLVIEYINNNNKIIGQFTSCVCAHNRIPEQSYK